MHFVLFKRPSHDVPEPLLLDEDESVFELGTQFLRWMCQSAKGYASGTIELYGKNLKYFCEYLRSSDIYSVLPLDHVVATLPGGVIDQYLRQVSGESSTRRTQDAILKKFFEWLTTDDAGRCRSSSGYETGLKSPSPKRKNRRYVLPQQVINLACAFHSESQRVALHTLYDVGLRVSELSRVSKEDIDALDHWPDDYSYLPLFVRGSKGRGGDHIKERYALISRAVYSRIKRYHASLEYRLAKVPGKKPAFLNTHGKPLRPKAFQRAIEQASKRANFAPRTISAHRLRHGTALSFLQGELGEEYLEKMVTLQTQFGHTNITATEAYTDIPPSLFVSINGNKQVVVRFEQAQLIYEKTYLPASKHGDRRKRRRK